jgi:F-type H+-transporting ATPase subunit a
VTISLAPEAIFSLGTWRVSNSMLTAALITLAMFAGAFLLRARLQRIPGKIQSIVEMIYDYFLTTIEQVVPNPGAAKALLPWIMTCFFFILISNWSGLVPGFGSLGVHHGEELVPLLRAPTSDLNAVGALAVLTVGFIQYLGLKFAGPRLYLSKFFSFKDPISFGIGILELISEFTRIVSFSFRLFGNVFAGEVLLGVIFYLTSTFVPYVPLNPFLNSSGRLGYYMSEKRPHENWQVLLEL